MDKYKENIQGSTICNCLLPIVSLWQINITNIICEMHLALSQTWDM